MFYTTLIEANLSGGKNVILHSKGRSQVGSIVDRRFGKIIRHESNINREVFVDDKNTLDKHVDLKSHRHFCNTAKLRTRVFPHYSLLSSCGVVNESLHALSTYKHIGLVVVGVFYQGWTPRMSLE